MTAVPQMTVPELIATYGEETARALARHTFWRRGDLRYLLHVGQLEAIKRIGRTPRRRFLMNVGRRWGKSRLMVVIARSLVLLRMLYRRGMTREEMLERFGTDYRWLVDAATRTKRKARVLYIAPTGDMIEEFVAPHMELLDEHCPPEFKMQLVGGRYVSADGDRIVMGGCEDKKKANRLRGSEADLVICDEWGFIPILTYVVKSVVGFQLTETRGRLLMPSTPPEETDHPGLTFLAEAEEAGAYFHATTEDAPHITPEMIEEIAVECGGRDTVDFQREAYARLVRDPAIVVVPEFDDHLVGAVERPEYFLPHIIGDLGFVDMSAIAFGYYDFKRDVYVIEGEVAGQRVLSDELDLQLRRKANELWGTKKVHRRRLDSTARERADLSAEEWQGEAEDVDTTSDTHWAAVSRDGGQPKGRMRALANRMRVICKERRLLVHPSCATIIAHLKHARWASNRSTFARVENEDGEPQHHYDGCAAALYFIRDCDTATNPFPKLPPGVTDDSHYIPPELRPEHRYAKVRQIFAKRGRRR